MRWLVALVYLVLAAATATAAVVATPEGEPGVEVRAAEGGFELSNSRDGAAVFTAAGIGPGDSASGTVELAGSGEPAELSLAVHDLADSPGTTGGLLSAQLLLLIREPGAGETLYSGPLATMPPQPLGRLEPGTPRRFEFVATLPDAGPGVDQNALQGAATSVDYAWTATAATELPPEPGSGQGGGGGDGAAPAPPPAGDLDLTVTKVRRQIKAGRLLVWARCDHACAIRAYGRIRAHDEDDRRSAKLRTPHRSTFRTGTQRLRIVLPPRMRRWLAADPSRERGRAKLRLLAWDASGDSDRARRTLRLRSSR